MHGSGAHSRRRYKDCDNEDDAGDVEDTREEYEDTSEDDEDADRTTGLISEEDDEPQTAGEGLDAATNQEDDAAPTAALHAATIGCLRHSSAGMTLEQ